MVATTEIAHYTQLNQLYSGMVEAAQQLHWDELVDLHNDSRQIVLKITHLPSQHLSPQERLEKARLIREIMDKQSKISAEVKDWQLDVAPMLGAWRPAAPG